MSIRTFEEPHTGKTHKSWIFTLNNYTEAQCDYIKGLEGIQRIAVGKERGASGTPHLQGVICWKTPKRFTQMKKLIPDAHWEKCMDLDMAFNYCRKELDMLCDVNNGRQGARRDLDRVYDAVEAGTPFDVFVREERPSLQHMAVFRTARLALMPDRPLMTNLQVIWLYGDSGTGKSRRAYESGAFRIPSYKWWDGYDGQPIIWFDEVRGDFCKYHEWLKLLDIYPFQVEVKGGWVKAQFHTVYITSDRSPTDMWASYTTENMRQLLRRVTEVVRYTDTPLGVVTVTEVGKGNTRTLPPWSSEDLELL